MKQHKPSANQQKGYSLMEMSVVLTVLAVIGIGALSVYQNSKDGEKIADTQERLKEINEALTNYINTHHRLPCPAQADLSESDSNFGLESKLEGDCSLGSPSATVVASAGDGNIAIGIIPARALGLTNSIMYDEWGRRITYVVDQRATKLNAMLEHDANLEAADGGLGNIQINNANGTPLSTQAVYVLLSHGINGIGAYQKNGTQMTDSRFSNALESENNDRDSVFVNAGYQRDSTDKFDQYDDITSYRERWSLITGADVAEFDDGQGDGNNEACPAYNEADVVLAGRYDHTPDLSSGDDLEGVFAYSASPSSMLPVSGFFESGTQIQDDQIPMRISFSPDNRFFFVSYLEDDAWAAQLFYNTQDGFRFMWDSWDPSIKQGFYGTEPGGSMNPGSIPTQKLVHAWSPDGQYLAAGSMTNNSGVYLYKFVNEHPDKCPEWAFDNSKPVTDPANEVPYLQYLRPSDGVGAIGSSSILDHVYDIEWHPTNPDFFVATGDNEGVEIFKKVADDRYQAQYLIDNDAMCSHDETSYQAPGTNVACNKTTHYHYVTDADWSPDGTQLAIAVSWGFGGEPGASIVIYDFDPDATMSSSSNLLKETYRFSTTEGSDTSEDETLGVGVAFSPDGQYLFHSRLQTEATIQVFKKNAGTGKFELLHNPATTAFPPPTTPYDNCSVPNVRDFRFSKDGSQIFLDLSPEWLINSFSVSDVDINDYIYLEFNSTTGNYTCHFIDDGLNTPNKYTVTLSN